MNFAINGSCSKGCSFCFTKEDARLKHTLGEMSIDMAEKLITHYKIKVKKYSLIFQLLQIQIKIQIQKHCHGITYLTQLR